MIPVIRTREEIAVHAICLSSIITDLPIELRARRPQLGLAVWDKGVETRDNLPTLFVV
jgi:hypothetical protein